jgi:hypothetical protein
MLFQFTPHVFMIYVYNYSYCALGDYGSCWVRDTERSQTTEDIFHGFWTWWRSKISLFLIPNHWFLLGMNFKNTLTQGSRFAQWCSSVFRPFVIWQCIPGILKIQSAIFFFWTPLTAEDAGTIFLTMLEPQTQQWCITCQKTAAVL